MVHHGFQQLTVVAAVHHVVLLERLGRDLAGDGARNHGIGRAGRDAQVVLQDVPSAVLRLYQVDARDVRIDALRRGDSLALGRVALGRIHEFGGDDTVADNVLVVIDIVQEPVQRIHPLDESFLQNRPVGGADDTGYGVEGKQLFLEGAVLVNAETNPKTLQPTVHRIPTLNQFVHKYLLYIIILKTYYSIRKSFFLLNCLQSYQNDSSFSIYKFPF